MLVLKPCIVLLTSKLLFINIFFFLLNIVIQFCLTYVSSIQVYYHLGAFEDSLTYALGADSLFDVNGVSEYVETIIGKWFRLC